MKRRSKIIGCRRLIVEFIPIKLMGLFLKNCISKTLEIDKPENCAKHIRASTNAPSTKPRMQSGSMSHD